MRSKLERYAKLYLNYEAETRLSSLEEDKIQERLQRFLKAHSAVFKECEREYMEKELVHDEISESETRFYNDLKNAVGLMKNEKAIAENKAKHELKEEIKKEKDKIDELDPEKAETQDEITKLLALNNKKQNNLKNQLEKQAKQEQELHRFQCWLYNNGEKKGFEYMNAENEGVREYLEQKFLNQPDEVQLRALFYLEKNYRKIDDAEERRNQLHEKEFQNYVPDVKRLKEQMVATWMKVWKFGDGSRFYWNKIKDALDKANEDYKAIKEEKEAKEEKAKEVKEPLKNDDNIINTNSNQDLGGMKEKEGPNENNDVLNGKENLNQPVDNINNPEEEKKPAAKKGNDSPNAVQRAIGNILNWNVHYSQVEKGLIENSIKMKTGDKKASFQATGKVKTVIAKDLFKANEDTLKKVDAAFGTYNAVTDLGFNALGAYNNAYGIYKKAKSGTWEMESTLDNVENALDIVESGARGLNSALNVVKGVDNMAFVGKFKTILPALPSGTSKDNATAFAESVNGVYGTIGTGLGIVADGAKLASGIVGTVKNFKRNKSAEIAKNAADREIFNAGNSLFMKEEERAATEEKYGKLSKRASLIEKLNSLNNWKTMPKIVAGAIGVTAGFFAIFGSPIALLGLAGAALGLASSKIFNERPARGKKRKAIDVEMLGDDMEKAKEKLADRIGKNYEKCERSDVRKRMKELLSIKTQKNNDRVAESVKSGNAFLHKHHLGNILRREVMAGKGHFSMNAAFGEIKGTIAKEAIDAIKNGHTGPESDIHRNILRGMGVATKKLVNPTLDKKENQDKYEERVKGAVTKAKTL